MAVRVSFSDVDKKDFTPIPAGVYPVVVTDAEESEQPGDSGYNYIIWEFTIPEGEYENRKLWVNTSLSPKAAFKLMELLEALGADGEAMKAEGEFDFEPSDYIGGECLATVKMKMWDGELRNEIKRLSPVGSAPSPTTAKKTTFGANAAAATPKRGMKIR